MGIIGTIGTVVGLVADFGASSFMSNVVTNMAVKSGNKVLDKVMIGVGSMVVAGMVGEAAQNYIKKKAENVESALTPVWMEDVKEIPEDFDDDFFEEETDETEEE